MATRRVATVFGGSGFIGRYVVKRLAAEGYVVRVAGRDPQAALFLKPMGAVGQVVPLYAALSDAASVARAIEGAELVINLVGILVESRPGDFDRVQAEGAAQVAAAASRQGVGNLIHLSAIGADLSSRSHYAASKGRGEAAMRAAFPSAVVLRPSVVFGPEDNFFNQFGRIAEFSPMMPVISGDTLMQPVYVGDVADAVMAARGRFGGLFELGGPRVLSFRDILRYILQVTERQRRLIEIPPGLARLQASVLERLPGQMLTRDQLIMLAQDNIVSPDMPSLATLGITPTAIELVVPAYLRRFRQGGGAAAA